ncbi:MULTISPECIES: cytochrome P450 [Saccharothrix]|uniref:Cytochrome P450 n=2 Tax=Saccharothrix TaxID=2071 RepID=A0ABU0WW55_9PSEU|nr:MULTISPECIES: cytochrome P450 [Saccharothrix]MDQ2583607.1 cytochrome P450 [Saccharothrix yanglingensis]MDR6594674.1 cytochrome P450 [Saccharothrix longispora]MDU0291024.1 cytochrome P450 [Saccharothrix longispora]
MDPAPAPGAPVVAERYPIPRSRPTHPAEEYAELRAHAPISRSRLDFDGSDVWLVTRHADACAVLADPRFSSDFSRPGFPARMTVRPPGPGTFIRMDAPDHTRLRRAVLEEFRPRRVEEMRPAITTIVDDLVSAMLAGPSPADLVQALALPLPTLVICELLGVPYDDRGFFQDRTAVIGDQEASPAARQVVRDELREYLDRLVTDKHAAGTDDLLGRMSRDRDRSGLTHDEVVGVATLLMIAGFETIANQIGVGTLLLLTHPDQFARLRAEPGLVVPAVEELARHQTVIDYGLRRVATEDVVVGGTTIRAGEGVVVVLSSANRDAEVYPDPDRFDITRDVRGHLAFGFGLHQCLGQLLARLQLGLLWTTLAERAPGLRLAVDLDEVPFRTDMFVHGVHSLPVTW